MKVWVDLANSPHPPLFAPIVRRLRREGHTVSLTARDHAQTLPLARREWPEVTPIFGTSPAGRVAKARAIADRVRSLRRWASQGFDVAVSHNSYAQLVAARSLRIPALTAMDYEHQPANHIGFRCAQRILLPEAVPLELVRRQGATVGKVRRYRGLKEQLYLCDFEPDRAILERIGVDGHEPGRPVVVARAGPADALYHPGDNPLLPKVLRELSERQGATIIALARHPAQRAAIDELGLQRCLVPTDAVDGRSLLCAADAFIGAGGTMTREAALLGVPTFTLFAGRPAAVDRWLEKRGAMRRLLEADEIGQIEPRRGFDLDVGALRSAAMRIEDTFVQEIIATAERGAS